MKKAPGKIPMLDAWHYWKLDQWNELSKATELLYDKA